MGSFMGVITFIILALISTVGLLVHFKSRPKYKCKGCMEKIDASQIVCQNCGTFVENDKKVGRATSFINKKLESNFESAKKYTEYHKK